MTIAVTSSTSSVGSATSANIPKPVLVNDNDILVVILAGKSGTTGTYAAQTGWTKYELNNAVGNNVYTGLFYRTVPTASALTGTFTFTGSPVQTYAAWISSLSGVNQTSPEDVSFSGKWLNQQNATIGTSPSLTTSEAGSFGYVGYCVNADTATTQSRGLFGTSNSDDLNGILNVYSGLFAAAGATTGTTALTAIAANQENNNGVFIFKQDSSNTFSSGSSRPTRTDRDKFNIDYGNGITQGLISLWTCDEKSGNYLIDKVRVNHGVGNNVSVHKYGGVDFSVSNSGFLMPSNLFNLENNRKFSMFVYVKYISSFSSNPVFFNKQIGTPFTGIAWQFHNSGCLRLQLINSSPTNMLDVRTKEALSTNTEYALMTTYDGSLSALGVNHYANGIKKDVSIVSDSLSASILNAGNCRIGNDSETGTTNNLNGVALMFALWDRELTDVEASQMTADPFRIFRTFHRRPTFTFSPPSASTNLTNQTLQLIQNNISSNKNVLKSSLLTNQNLRFIQNALTASRNDLKSALLTNQILRLIQNNISSSKSSIKSSSLSNQVLRFTQNNVSATRNDPKVSSLSNIIFRLVQGTASASSGAAVDNKSTTITNITIRLNQGAVTAQKSVNKSSSLTTVTINLVQNSPTVSRGENKSASLTQQKIVLVTGVPTVSKSVVKTANLTTITLVFKTANLTVSAGKSKQASLSQAIIRLVMGQVSAGQPVAGSSLAITILLNSQVETTVNGASRIETTLLGQSGVETTVNSSSRVDKYISEKSQIETTINQASLI